MSSSRPLASTYHQTCGSAFHVRSATGAKTTTAVTSATAVAASTSGAFASNRFHSAWNTAAARAKARAAGGMRRRYARTRMPPRAVAFDFNGTLSDDEAVLARVYCELIPGLTESDYYSRLAGHTDEFIFDGDESLIAARVARYNELVTDGSTVDDEV